MPSGKGRAWTPTARTGPCSNQTWLSRARHDGRRSPRQLSTPGCGPSSAFPSKWGRCVSGRSTFAVTGPGRSAMTSTLTRSSWRASPPAPSSSCRRTPRQARLAAELEEGADFHFVVHQAAGMVAAQLEVSVGQALVRLRAFAFANDRPLTEVARDVVEKTLRFGTDNDEKDRGA